MPGGVGVRAVFDGDCVMELCADGAGPSAAALSQISLAGL